MSGRFSRKDLDRLAKDVAYETALACLTAPKIADVNQTLIVARCMRTFLAAYAERQRVFQEGSRERREARLAEARQHRAASHL